MARFTSATMAMFLLIGLLMATSYTVSAALTCGQTVGKISNCLPYLSGRTGPSPSRDCCDGVVELNNELSTKPARQAACSCLKRFSNTVTGLNPGLIRSLPSSCNVRLNFVVTTSINCNTVS